MRKLVLLLAALVLVVAIPACGGEEDEQALPETVEGTLPADTGGATEGDPANGKTIYASAAISVRSRSHANAATSRGKS